MVITFANDGVQIFQTKFHKDMPQWNYHGIPIYHHLPNNCIVNNLMGHSHHFSSTKYIANLLMVGCSKINDVILLHLVNCPLTMANDQTRDFATIHKC
jgi:acetate kinase